MTAPLSGSDCGTGWPDALPGVPRRLFHQNLSLWRDRRLARVLQLAGHELRPGLPGPEDGVLVWGHRPTAWRGAAVAARRGVPLVRVEDAFLRSIHPGRARGEAPIGYLIDAQGLHFDSRRPSRIEQILATTDFHNSNILIEVDRLISCLIEEHLSKYNNSDLALPSPDPGYVLVVDQTRDDAAIRLGGASAATFRAMLDSARRDHPDRHIVIRTHPETAAGLRPGHFGPADAGGRVSLLSAPVSPHRLLAGAAEVYAVTSQMGFEAILHGHRPRIFGQPFYAGWGLSRDEQPIPRRTRRLTRNELFAGAMLLAPLWYDPCRDRLCGLEEVIRQLAAEARAFREDRRGHVAAGMRLWKRPRLQAVFGGTRALRFRDDPAAADRLARASGRGLLIWAGKEPEGFAPQAPCLRVEDGFLRSRGLGAELVPPLSLVTDDLGIYYDPTRPSRLEALIATPLTPAQRRRIEAFLDRLRAAGVTKYNLGGAAPPLPEGHRILVPGQVEDDASIRRGAGAVRTNLALLRAVRAANPGAVLIYKPHPDVEAGLRAGAIAPADLRGLADVVAQASDPVPLLGAVQEVWTMTSLLGFEALLRGLPVTCLGAPFYAGWGLTRDLGPVPARRVARPDLLQLAHAALITYPRYWDPVSRRPCPPEVALQRLAEGGIPHPGRLNRLVSKLQGRFASLAPLWR
ncbi:capsular polysaccharide biosynthesis protein [Rhodobacter calidifons]|uniref:Capsular polysaccharide biosynthesis protein n=1 Tax=Rhodobacter calidifons TaxID=2715277 RepID=A0ABX0G1P1_9RHOB|nr:capsular polysaccharide biosynthesis protein [Rhodobacter calidifons]NHB75140.1 capsular polysaccharide biosynthesis protein [Rhodobacter calidifons]